MALIALKNNESSIGLITYARPKQDINENVAIACITDKLVVVRI